MTTARWMESAIRDDQHLCEITMPGSHDAGVYAGDATSKGLSGTSNTVCQSDRLIDQCKNGSRFFDLRVMNHSGELVAHHTTKVLGTRHGAFGGALEKMLDDLTVFVMSNPSEFVIARFSKCGGHASIVEAVKRCCGDVLLKEANVLISHCRVRQLRGKIIAVFADDFSAQINQLDGIHPFQKYNGGGIQPGLTTCGSYADQLDIVKVYKDQITKVHEHDNHNRRDHLHVMYWTQTSGTRDIRKFTTATSSTSTAADQIPTRSGGGGAHAFAEHMTTFVKDKMERRGKGVARPSLPNVVMYDFVNPQTSALIIALNSPQLELP